MPNKEEKDPKSTDENDPKKKEVKWTEQHEDILIDWADKAMCYSWLHSRAFMYFNVFNMFFTIPVIVISTITGTANFAQERIPVDYRSYAVMVIGTCNILAGIITTVKQFLKISELNEAHRVSSLAWNKYYRNIRTELAQSPDERLPVSQMLKASKDEFDRLMESSPSIPSYVIKQFKIVFDPNENVHKKIISKLCMGRNCTLFDPCIKLCCRHKIPELNKKQQDRMKKKLDKVIKKKNKLINYESIAKPEICGVLKSTKDINYRSKVKVDHSTGSKEDDVTVDVNSEFIEKIHEFIVDFEKIQGRIPRKDEIIDQFDDFFNEDFTEEILLKEYQSIIGDESTFEAKE